MVKARQGVELITSGELLVVDEQGKEVPWDGQTLGEIVVRGNVVMQGYYSDPEAPEVRPARREGCHRRSIADRRRRPFRGPTAEQQQAPDEQQSAEEDRLKRVLLRAEV